MDLFLRYDYIYKLWVYLLDDSKAKECESQDKDKTDEGVKDKDDKDDDSDEDSGLYQVPPPAKPVEFDGIKDKYLYTVSYNTLFSFTSY